LQRNSKTEQLSNINGYYKSIDDLPLDNWIKCNDGDLTYVRKKNDKGTEEQDELIWESIYNSYIDEFGLDKMYKKMLDSMKKRVELELDYVITEDRFKLTLINMEITRLEQLIANAGVGMSIQESLIHLSRWMGSFINTKNITTREYFTLLKEYGKAN
jgi:hypothetical protein